MSRSSRWVRVAYALVAVLAGGCIESGLVPCGDLACPPGDTCVAGELCASAGQIAACDGIADTGTCSIGATTGRCDRGVCVATGCGNGIVDPGEACDDGNTTGGDGCSADCRKVEVCGDGIVDDGEGCDDGNRNPADGCDACVPTVWTATVVIGGDAMVGPIDIALPVGVALDRSGNLYVADTVQHRVRKRDPAGVFSVVAGTGTPGSSGDGGAAASAQLGSPAGIAVDGLGDLYIADSQNHRVRRVDAAGTITTIAGTGVAGFAGDGGAATAARLNAPSGIAVDGFGDVYIGDAGNNRVRRISTGGTITTIAGSGPAGSTGDGGAAIDATLASPHGIALDTAGNLYIADLGNNRIRRVDVAGVIATVAGSSASGSAGDGGPAISAEFDQPTGIAVDATGALYVADSGNSVVRRIDATGVITAIAGMYVTGYGGDGGLATSALLDQPADVAVDAGGAVYFSDQRNNRVRRIDAAGIITTVVGTGLGSSPGDGGAATSAALDGAQGVAADGLGNVYFGDGNNRLRRVDAAGLITTVAGTGEPGDGGDGGPATSAQLGIVGDVTLDQFGRIYFSDLANDRVRRVDEQGVISTVAGSGFGVSSGDGGPATSATVNTPSGLAVDSGGELLLGELLGSRVRRVDLAGVINTVVGTGVSGYSGDGGDALLAQITQPVDLALDAQGDLFIADPAAGVIRRVDATTHVITTVAGTGSGGFRGDGGNARDADLAAPNGVAVDAIGDLYIADTLNQRVRRVAHADGVITTVVGTGTTGSAGDGGPAGNAQLQLPRSLAFDGVGNLYIGDGANNRVRRVDAAGVITTAAGQVAPEGMGPFSRARIGDPRALVMAAPFTFFAGGSTGTVQAARTDLASLDVVAGRYPQAIATGALARFRDQTFGSVGGVAYDQATGLLYLTETTANRLHVITIVDPADANTWTIEPVAGAAGIAGFADGPAAAAEFRAPTGLFLDPAAHQLYVADTGNHAIRAIDLSAGPASATVRTVAGVPATRGFSGDSGPAPAALLFAPEAMTRCANGDLFIADTGNQRVRRVAAGTGTISTVLGVGVADSSGAGRPAVSFPVNAPRGLTCDATGNLLVTSTTAVKLMAADTTGVVDGSGDVQTIYGAPPRSTFPVSVTSCLTGVAVVDATTIQVVDSCTGLLVELRRAPR